MITNPSNFLYGEALLPVGSSCQAMHGFSMCRGPARRSSDSAPFDLVTCSLLLRYHPRMTNPLPIQAGAARPLGHYRVIELPGAVQLSAGKSFADLGADVIKIEPPGGDPAR